MDIGNSSAISPTNVSVAWKIALPNPTQTNTQLHCQNRVFSFLDATFSAQAGATVPCRVKRYATYRNDKLLKVLVISEIYGDMAYLSVCASHHSTTDFSSNKYIQYRNTICITDFYRVFGGLPNLCSEKGGVAGGAALLAPTTKSLNRRFPAVLVISEI